MANSAGSRKRARQAEKRRQHNASLRSMVRTYIKKVQVAIEAGDKAAAEAAFKTAQPILDGSVNKGIFHKNKIARTKSRMVKQIVGIA
ncbi:30S ribosomal protein S20 [Neptuniibacter pectenicola]|uniref:Small ribosomal subunit protein bS20 n=1 Tax=Neptuniibacter pectenicola TaxID=1806669 RepID=A0ABU9TU54_9GAMM|nr:MULTISPECIES: 30S ribosomal protein S20 [Neptuniibacter]KXJ53509.1 MAG: 30S ribosomal protein S20 [Neptuniibacter sp. Phe_28]MDO6513894.1 30S ribosomal protein S20 [Neptuniibacter sp. 2_MG-2023]MDO6593147.1 30S ribosomal protein S20 [Neptuniibacter sp. 1_MG-2023]